MTTDLGSSSRPEPSWLRRHRGKVIASLVIGAAFVWILQAGALPFVPDRQALAGVQWWVVLAYIALWSVVHVLRAARWSFLLRPIHPLPLRKVVAVAFVGFAAIVLLPLRTGEAVRPVLIRKKGALSGWAATGTVGAERVIDGLVLSAFLLVALELSEPLSPLPDRIGDLAVPVSIVPTAAYIALMVFAAAFVVMGLFYWRRAWARRMTHAVFDLVSPRLASWLSERVESVADGLQFLPRARHTAPFLAATAAYWLLNAAAAWMLARGCGLSEFTFVHGCVTTGVLALGILVPSAPGFFGAYQVSVYASFLMYFPHDAVIGPGAAYVFIAYICQLGITITAGAIGMLMEHTRLEEALATD